MRGEGGASDPLTLIHGDCIEVMRAMDEASLDAIVTDPPYGLEFMGKDWDAPWKVTRPRPAEMTPVGVGHQGSKGPYLVARVELHARKGPAFQQWTGAWAREALRVLKPGGHLLALGGTRTFHRMTVAIEDAGFEIRDCLMWLYGSGFPKSLDVSKAIDKAAGATREVVRVPSKSGNAERRGESEQGATYGDGHGGFTTISAPVIDLARQWQGWGTALKPAWEPIILARKPLVGTVAENVERYGSGALNIDASRVGNPPRTTHADGNRVTTIAASGHLAGKKPHSATAPPSARWPANVLLDEGAAAMLDEQSGERRSAGLYPTTYSNSRGYGGVGKVQGPLYADSGGASRFFYIAKASRAERAGSTHPTVKPVALMRYLIRLVTPPSGLVLDPFAGSGTTGQAALAEGFRCILIEKEAEYVEGIKKWRAGMQLGLGFASLPKEIA